MVTKIERPQMLLHFKEVRYIVKYLQNYETRNGIPHPGGDPDPPVFLPCSDTKMKSTSSIPKIAERPRFESYI